MDPSVSAGLPREAAQGTLSEGRHIPVRTKMLGVQAQAKVTRCSSRFMSLDV